MKIASQAQLRSLRKNVSPQAYESYLKGRYFWNQRTDEGFAELLSISTKLLPASYVWAHLWLSRTRIARRMPRDAIAELERIQSSEDSHSSPAILVAAYSA